MRDARSAWSWGVPGVRGVSVGDAACLAVREQASLDDADTGTTSLDMGSGRGELDPSSGDGQGMQDTASMYKGVVKCERRFEKNISWNEVVMGMEGRIGTLEVASPPSQRQVRLKFLGINYTYQQGSSNPIGSVETRYAMDDVIGIRQDQVYPANHGWRHRDGLGWSGAQAAPAGETLGRKQSM